jgi:type VI secretion system ImpA family protein
MRRLCAERWEQIFPELQGELTPRLAIIQWVNEKLSRRLRLIQLTQPEMAGVPAYTLADWDVAIRNPGSGSTDSAITVGKFELSANLTPYTWFLELNRDLDAAREAVLALEVVIDDKMGKPSSGLGRFRAEVLAATELSKTMLSVAYANLPEPPTPAETALVAEETESPVVFAEPLAESRNEMEHGDAGGLISGLRLSSRSDAYRLLEEIALYLQKTEPHSPTPYLIRRAIAWGEMRFDELLPELVRDQGELSEIMKLLRLDQPMDSSE